MVREEFLNCRDSPQLDYLKMRGELVYYLDMERTHLPSKSLRLQGTV